MIFGFNDNTPCVIAHDKIENLYYTENTPEGFTRNLQDASKFIGAKARMNGIAECLKRFPKANKKNIIFSYLA